MTSRFRAPELDRLVPVPTHRGHPSTAAADLVGKDLSGAPATVEVTAWGRTTLILFLSSTCDGCRPLWEACGCPSAWGLSADATVVVVTRALDDVLALRRLTPAGVTLVLSDQAWRAYRVQGAPFFCLVEGGRPLVVTEGVAWGVAQVAADVNRALDLRGS